LNRSTMEQVLSMLHQENLPAKRSVLQTAVHTSSVSKYSAVIHRRYAHVQDEGSQLISQIAVSLGSSLFDFCAGNGGKSLAIASMTQNHKTLHAYEINSAKRTTLKQRCIQYAANVTIEDNVPKRFFDVVLVDAPCTGLGAARRNPEAKYVDGADNLPQTQMSLLSQAAANVTPGGFLFYAVCTITPEETSHVIETFMGSNIFSLVQAEDLPNRLYFQETTNGFISRIPKGDLFFISVLKKPSLS